MLFTALSAPALRLRNRIVMAPMTRNRAVAHNTPNALMAEYYGQRAMAGLIVTEGTSPSPNGLGYARILIAFARPFIANPDLPARLQADAVLNPLDMATFYTPGPKGYTDYPALSA